MTHHHQATRPATWHIADQANLPSGRTLTGTAARVYNLLAQTALHAHAWQVGRHQAPPGWVPTWVLREPWAGGAAGDRRLRDLRQDGLPIESQRFESPAGETTTWLWRLSPLSRPAGGDGRGAGGEALLGPGERSESPSPSPLSRSGRADGGRTGEGPGERAPLHGLTITLTATRPTHPPAHPGAVEISPGALSPLAPPITVIDDDTYRNELRHRYHTGQLAAALAGRHDWTLWTDPDALYDPRPVLAGALTALGATVTGAAHLGA